MSVCPSVDNPAQLQAGSTAWIPRFNKLPQDVGYGQAGVPLT